MDTNFRTRILDLLKNSKTTCINNNKECIVNNADYLLKQLS